MNPYSLERWLLERHEAAVTLAESRARLVGTLPRTDLGAWMAARLRRLADRIDRGSVVEPHASARATIISNGPF